MANRIPCSLCGRPVPWPRTHCGPCKPAVIVQCEAQAAVRYLHFVHWDQVRSATRYRLHELVAEQGFAYTHPLRTGEALRLIEAAEQFLLTFLSRENHQLILAAAYAQHEETLRLVYEHYLPEERANAEQGKCACLMDILLSDPGGTDKPTLDCDRFALALDMAYSLQVAGGNYQLMAEYGLPCQAGEFFQTHLKHEATRSHLKAAAEWIELDARVDFEADDPDFQALLRQRGLSLEQIRAAMSRGLEPVLGFTDADISRLLTYATNMEEGVHILTGPGIVQVLTAAGMQPGAARALISLFSFGPQPRGGRDLLQRMTQLERRVFLPIKHPSTNTYLVGRHTLHLTVSAAWRATERNALLKAFLPPDAIAAAQKTTVQVQQLHADRLELLTAYVWVKAGLAVPLMDGQPQAKIKKVLAQGRIIFVESSPGQTLGDLDALAGDPVTRTILIAECKLAGHRGLTPKDFVRVEQSSLDDVLTKIERRHAWVEANLPSVAEFLGLDPTHPYTVRTIIVTEAEHFIRHHLPAGGPITHASFWELVKTYLPQEYKQYRKRAGLPCEGRQSP